MPGHQKLAPGREFYELLVLNQVSHACTSKLAPGVSSGRLGVTLHWAPGRAALGAWVSNSSGATFPGLFQAQINCQPKIFIYQNEAPDGIEHDLVKEILKDAKAS
ncbi:hypothetical protein PIB30_043953 [Stylosanthes scabra]|uniref:Uncharacterized protein n=1 Tax=Stylosanthes scabra TaxID=79078 RepID=A0ABU6YEM0_9FABA|nr:hypothetical protein [Stylosanthes scabra]